MLQKKLGDKREELKAQITKTDTVFTANSFSDIEDSSSDVISIKVNNYSFDLILVDGGTFSMGATNEQSTDAYDSEFPVHKVTLGKYYIGKFEVTQGLWQVVMGSNPSYFKYGDNYPIENVSWIDCQEFIFKLNSLIGKNFRLPTEAEWE